jgi:formate dehydrogenase gamma subunit
MTLPIESKSKGKRGNRSSYVPDPAAIEQARLEARLLRWRKVRSLAARVQQLSDGSRLFVRFSQAQCLEHQILIVSFTTLALTGLLQRYSQYFWVGVIINLLGGIDTMRVIHHLAAIVLIIQTIYHTFKILQMWFVERELGAMWPYWQDVRDLVHMIAYNLGRAKTRPEFDRYSVEEKVEYWALVWGTPLMIVTGLVMWFPVAFTRIFPGDIVPVSTAIHSWEALLAALAIVTWHLYHTVIKEKNRSIFTGTMTEHEMQHGHPLEYRRILAAFEYVQQRLAEKERLQDKPDDKPAEPEAAKKELHREVV